MFSWHPADPDSSVGLPDVEAWFVIPENAFPLLQSPMAASFTPLQPTLGIAHGELRLVFGWSKPISWSSRRTVLGQTLLPEAVWNSVVSVATEDRQFLYNTRCSTWRFCSVSLCGLPIRGWAVVAPRHFHFTTTAQLSSSSRAKIWWNDLLERWHPMTVPLWKSLSSSVKSFYWQCLSMENAWMCDWYYTTVNNWCEWNSRIH